MPRALVGKLRHAEHLRPERAANGVEKVGERNVCRTLAGRAAGSAGETEGVEVVAGGGGEVSVGGGHIVSSVALLSPRQFMGLNAIYLIRLGAQGVV